MREGCFSYFDYIRVGLLGKLVPEAKLGHHPAQVQVWKRGLEDSEPQIVRLRYWTKGMNDWNLVEF